MMRCLALVPLLALAACGGANQTTQLMLAGPAAQNCTAHQGQILVKQTGDGSRGFCALPDGRTITLQEFFSQTNR